MRRFREHTKTAATATAFVVFVVLILVSYRSFGESNIIGRSAGNILGMVQRPFAYAGRFLDERFSVFFRAGELAAENERLKERVGELEREMTEAGLSAADLEELRHLSEVLNYSDAAGDYRLITADVIALDKSSGFSTFTISAGSNRGVTKGATVIDGNGLIGRVLEVGDDRAKVVSVIDESNNVGFQVFRNLEWLGVLRGDGEGALTGYMLDETVAVREGDRLITSGIGGNYPPGITIGKVTKVEWNHDSPLKTVRVEPAAYFKNIRKVTVLV